MAKPTVAILGASAERHKFGNKSVRAHLLAGYDVYPVNPNADKIEGLRCYPSLADVPVENLDRISLYLPPRVGIKVLPEIQAKGAAEVWFNPGTDSAEIKQQARDLGLNAIYGCSIVNVGVSPHDLPDE